MTSGQSDLELLSLKLSEVLEDIGINDETINRRRQLALFKESIIYPLSLIDKDIKIQYFFGSQSEGTTTIGLKSDKDILSDCFPRFNVINDFSYWEQGRVNLLIVQDETTAPGYCILQLLKDDVPLPVEGFINEVFSIDYMGRVVLRNTIFPDAATSDLVQHGPALMLCKDGSGIADMVYALRCPQWPIEAKQWLTRANKDGWPNDTLKSSCEKSGCFLVPLDSKISGLVGVEWRISTSLAERYLMFSLNTTHLKCYVLMKIVLKSYDVFHDVISSYMCKIVLLYCVENTQTDFWQDRNLLRCFDKLLRDLYTCIQQVKCPHFIIPENNLMANKISPSQQRRLLTELDNIIQNKCKKLLDIKIDNLGERLRHKIEGLSALSPQYVSKISMCVVISDTLLYSCAFEVMSRVIDQCEEKSVEQVICKYNELCDIFPQLNTLQQEGARYILSLMSTTIGSKMASSYIQKHGCLSQEAVEWLKAGHDSDVSSSLLKLASVYYSAGDMKKTVDLLTFVDKKYDRSGVMPVCVCRNQRKKSIYKDKYKYEYFAMSLEVTDFRKIISYCVGFRFTEMNIVPLEMRQDFFGSSREEIKRRDRLCDKWMDRVVVDSLPYLYFLQYKTYSSLKKNEEKQRVLNKLKNVMIEEPNVHHEETVYNLLGQCMEQEDLLNDAFQYYGRSLEIRPRHNAANFYLSRLQCRRMSERVFVRRTWAQRCLFVCLFSCVRFYRCRQQFFSYAYHVGRSVLYFLMDYNQYSI